VGPERLWAEIDLGAMGRNVVSLRRRLPRDCALIAVVKADAYGHGAVACARAALAAGASELAVGDASEGERLRAAGIDAAIALVGPSSPLDAVRIVAHRLVPAVADLELARALAAAATRPLDVEVEIDTGLCRHGVPAPDALAFVRALRVHKALRVRGVFTHFAGLGADDQAAMRAQWQRFAATVAALRAAGCELRAHACNTLGTLLLPEAHADAVRIGGGLHGFDPGAPGHGLLPVLTLATRVAGLRRAQRGDRVGYGGTHAVAADTTLALLPCGYADGLSRAHWDGAHVLLGGRLVPVVGHVSMNQMVVDAGDAAVALGDEVVLLGVQGDQRVRPEQRAAPGCSAYEVTALLRPDLPRRHHGLPAAAAIR
jgi:alanine racemase